MFLNKIVKLMINLIPLKSVRRHLRRYYFDENYRKFCNQERRLSKYNDKNFFNSEVRDNSILIVEPNSYHADALASYTKYFIDLGFNVDIMLRHENCVDNSFVLCPKENVPRIFKGNIKHIKKLLSLDKLKKYEYVFISTSAYWQPEIGYFDSFINYLGFEPKGKNGLLMIEHNLDSCLKEYKEEKYLKENRLFTLSGFHNTPMLNPNYYGNVKITDKSEEIVNFTVVAGIQKYCKDHDLIINATEQLLKENITNFQINIIGKGNIKIPVELSKYINVLGYLSFLEVFQQMEKADFCLALLNPNIAEHQKYLSGTTTGSRQLSLGFATPILINNQFAQAYSFNNSNAVIYDGNDLYSAMKQAIYMDKSEYNIMQNNLKILRDTLWNESLNNLKKSISETSLKTKKKEDIECKQ